MESYQSFFYSDHPAQLLSNHLFVLKSNLLAFFSSHYHFCNTRQPFVYSSVITEILPCDLEEKERKSEADCSL